MSFIRLTPNDKRSTTTRKISPEEKRAYYRGMVKNHIEGLRKNGASDEDVAKFKNGLSDFIKKEIAPQPKPIVAKSKEGSTVTEALFDVIYSVDIPVEIKEATLDVVECLPIEISESYVSEEVDSFIEFLDSIVYSSASEELVQQVLDEVLPSLDEAFINEVSNEWVNRKVQNSLAARKSAADKADKSVKSGLIGLSQLNRQEQAHQRLDAGKAKANSIQARLDKRIPASQPQATEPKAEGAMGRLKSAVGKVKAWTKGEDNTPVGLGRLVAAKANKDNIGAEALRQQTTHKVGGTTGAPKVEKDTQSKAEEVEQDTQSKAEEVEGNLDSDPVAKSIRRNQEKVEKNRSYRIKQAKLKAKGTKLPDGEKPIKMGNERINRINAARERAKGTKLPDGEKPIKLGNERIDRINAAKERAKGTKLPAGEEPINIGPRNQEEGKTKNSKTKAALNIANDGKPSAEEGTNKEIKATTTGKNKTDYQQKLNDAKKSEAALLKKINGAKKEATKAKYQDQLNKLQRSIKGYEKKLAGVANEALTELALTLLNTNISEGCFVEVMEMAGANKKNIEKVQARYDNKWKEAMQKLDNDVNEKGTPDPEHVKEADVIARRKEHFEEMAKNKLGAC